VLTPTYGQKGSGNATFLYDPAAGLSCNLVVCNLPPLTTHGFHIHAWGDISFSDGNAAGSHFNPYNVSHACSGTRHVGDIVSDSFFIVYFYTCFPLG